MMQKEGSADMLPSTSVIWSQSTSTMEEDSAYFERLLADLRTLVAQQLPAKAVDEREEIVQEAAIKVWKMLERGTKTRPDLTRTYLRRVSYSVFIDLVRSTKRRQEEPFEPEEHDVRAPDAVNPEAEAVGRELGREIDAALKRLERSRRRAVVLYLNGHSVREIAAILGWSYKKSENLVYRGLAQLRDWLPSWRANGRCAT